MVGRYEEISIFNDLLNSGKSELVLVTGRRRVGKTYMIRQVLKENICFEFIGTQYGEPKNQLEKFSDKLNHYFPKLKTKKNYRNWTQALQSLSEGMETLRRSKKKRVVFIDEFPWIAQSKSKFLQEFDYWWNSWASQQNILVVITGSATSWMIKKIVENKAGLHNRITQRIHLNPFTLAETKLFLESKKINLDYYPILQLYMVTGGIPYYLENIKKGESVAQNINRICFYKNGLLRNEFQNLYHALFEKAENHIEVIRALATKWKGLTRQEIIKSTRLNDGGGLSTILEELETCGFILKIMPYQKKTKDALYRLIDEYSLFYIHFIEKSRVSDKNVWLQKSTTQPFKIWQGYAFENLCMRHHEAIKTALGISGIFSEISSFYHKGNADTNGFQIDMLIDRADNTMNICEMKFYTSELVIDRAFAETLRTQTAQFQQISKTKKLLLNTLITTFGVLSNEHSLSQINHIITADKLFSLERFN
ncbi:MAG: AAA family ATPase [Chitinophagales bacterium]